MSEEKENMSINEKHIMTIGDKQFVKFEGLLDLAHRKGLKSVYTEMLTDPNAETIIFKARANFDDKWFNGHGDANDKNVGRMVAVHKIRMAETRAIARALRLGCNVGMCSAEEMGGDKLESKNNTLSAGKILPKPITQTISQTESKITPDTPTPKSTPSTAEQVVKCLSCHEDMTEKQIKYSRTTYDTDFCFDCQRLYIDKKIDKNGEKIVPVESIK